MQIRSVFRVLLIGKVGGCELHICARMDTIQEDAVYQENILHRSTVVTAEYSTMTVTDELFGSDIAMLQAKSVAERSTAVFPPFAEACCRPHFGAHVPSTSAVHLEQHWDNANGCDSNTLDYSYHSTQLQHNSLPQCYGLKFEEEEMVMDTNNEYAMDCSQARNRSVPELLPLPTSAPDLYPLQRYMPDPAHWAEDSNDCYIVQELHAAQRTAELDFGSPDHSILSTESGFGSGTTSPPQLNTVFERPSSGEGFVQNLLTEAEDVNITGKRGRAQETNVQKQRIVKKQRITSGNQEGEFQCHECLKRYKQQRQLNRHERTHSNEGRHPCTFCPKAFYDKFDLKRHLRTHTNVRPFQCQECPKNFTQRCSLEAHLRTMHGVQLNYDFKQRRAKLYVCEDCGNSTEQAEVHYAHLHYNHPDSPALQRFSDKRFFKFSKTALVQHMNISPGQ